MLGSLCIQPLQKSALGTIPMVADGIFMATAPSGIGEWMVFCESDLRAWQLFSRKTNRYVHLTWTERMDSGFTKKDAPADRSINST